MKKKKSQNIALYKKIVFVLMQSAFIYIFLFRDFDNNIDFTASYFLSYQSIGEFFGAFLLLFICPFLYRKEYKNKSLHTPDLFLITVLPPIVFIYQELKDFMIKITSPDIEKFHKKAMKKATENILDTHKSITEESSSQTTKPMEAKKNEEEFDPFALPQEPKRNIPFHMQNVPFHRKLIFLLMQSAFIYIFLFEDFDNNINFTASYFRVGDFLTLFICPFLYRTEYKEKTLPKPNFILILLFPPAVFFWD